MSHIDLFIVNTAKIEEELFTCNSLHGQLLNPSCFLVQILWYDEKGSLITANQSVSYSMVEDSKRTTAQSTLNLVVNQTHHNQHLSCVTLNAATSAPLSTKVLLDVKYPPLLQMDVNPGELESVLLSFFVAFIIMKISHIWMMYWKLPMSD